MRISVSIVKGTNKIHCEDSVLINGSLLNDEAFYSDTSEIKCIVVADGVGGAIGGKEASKYILTSVSTAIKDTITLEDFRRSLIRLNEELIAFGKLNGMPNMATTFTGIFQVEDKFYLAHIGNTRLSVLQGEYLKQITDDHTTYQWLVSMGDYTAAEKCNKSEINGCFGSGNAKLLERLEVKEVFAAGIPNTMILTSDGIHDYVDLDTMEEEIVGGADDMTIINNLIEKASINGSMDDKSVVIIRR